MNVEVAGCRLELLPERALFWPEAQTLFIADLHVGKVETFQRHGIALPSEAGVADLARLDHLLARLTPRRLWVLGDLIHDRAALAVPGVAALAQRHPAVSLHLIRGNHDRHLPALPAAWRFECHGEGFRLGPFVLQHQPNPAAEAYQLAGHLHPVVRVSSRADALRLPCFQFGPRAGLLPAFTAFSGGVAVDRGAGATYAIADGDIIAV